MIDSIRVGLVCRPTLKQSQDQNGLHTVSAASQLEPISVCTVQRLQCRNRK